LFLLGRVVHTKVQNLIAFALFSFRSIAYQ